MTSTQITYVYPNSMKKLTEGIRIQAIKIANAMLEDCKDMDDKILIETAISRAKYWAAHYETSSKRKVIGLRMAV